MIYRIGRTLKEFMRKRQPDYEKKYSPLKVYLDDLEHIVQIPKAENLVVLIHHPEFEFDSVAELSQTGNTWLTNIIIFAAKDGENYATQGLSVLLMQMSAGIFSKSKDPLILGVCAQIEPTLAARARALPWLYSFPLLSFICFLFSFTTKCFPPTTWALALLSVVPLVVIVGWMMFTALIRFKRHGIVITHPRREHSTFWKRNGEKLVTHAITTVITLVVGFVVGRATSFVGSQPATTASPATQPSVKP